MSQELINLLLLLLISDHDNDEIYKRIILINVK